MSERESRQGGAGESGSGSLGNKEQTGTGGRGRSGDDRDQGGDRQKVLMRPGVAYDIKSGKHLG